MLPRPGLSWIFGTEVRGAGAHAWFVFAQLVLKPPCSTAHCRFHCRFSRLPVRLLSRLHSTSTALYQTQPATASCNHAKRVVPMTLVTWIYLFGPSCQFY